MKSSLKKIFFGGYKIGASFGEEFGMKFSFMKGRTLEGKSIMNIDFGFIIIGFM